ncbi:hypothetical protein ACFWBH_01565 [Streptomyces sp. NPDC059999]|uniref:hypothetical protein n=1 Tax=Streptomyces sp. NPDC059999 TaxID=3347030 RepID=UPI00369254E8
MLANRRDEKMVVRVRAVVVGSPSSATKDATPGDQASRSLITRSRVRSINSWPRVSISAGRKFADQMLGYIVMGILMEQRQGDVT